MLLGLLPLLPVEAKPPPKPGITPDIADESYGPEARNTLDLWLAKSDEPTPLVVFIHGGGWHGGDKGRVPTKMLKYFLDHGISVASINYRYTSMAILPAPLMDAARALQFLRSRAADWNLNPGKFGAIGVSAGGLSALWLALHDDLADGQSSDVVAKESSRIQAAVGLSAQTSLEPARITEWIGDQAMAHPMTVRAVGARKRTELLPPSPDRARLLQEASPINYVSADDPPVLLEYPTEAPLPAESAGQAIHHAIFGRKLKEQIDLVGGECILRIKDQNAAETPTPEQFLEMKLKAE